MHFGWPICPLPGGQSPLNLPRNGSWLNDYSMYEASGPTTAHVGVAGGLEMIVR